MVALAATLTGLRAVLAPSPEPPSASTTPADLSRRGPTRFLRLESASLSPEGILEVQGQTNLPAGSALRVRVRSAGMQLVEFADRLASSPRLRLRHQGVGFVGAGGYTVSVSFQLADQPQELREALHYQPALLADEIALRVLEPTGVSPAAELRKLVADVNRLLDDKAQLPALEQRAKQLDARLWLGAEQAALTKLRLALEEAAKEPADRRRVEAHLVAAHVLLGG